MSFAVLVEMEALLDTVAASVVAGIGVTTVFSVAIWGAAAYAEYSAEGRTVAAAAAAIVGIVAAALTVGAAVVGLIVMTST